MPDENERTVTANHTLFMDGQWDIQDLYSFPHHGLRPYDVSVQKVDRKAWQELENRTFYHKGMAGLRGPDDQGQDCLLQWFDEFTRQHKPRK